MDSMLSPRKVHSSPGRGYDLEKFPTIETTEWRRPNKKRRRRTIASQILFCVLGLWALYLFFSPTEISQQKILVKNPLETTADPVVSGGEEQHPLAQNITQSEVTSDVEDAKDEKNDATTQLQPVKPTTKLPGWHNTDLVTSLNQLFSTLPDELQVENLLRPIETTGEARLRELGLRSRYYKSMFDAWERVHLVSGEDDNALYIRDEIIQYLQQHTDVSKELGMSVTEAMRSYETYRSTFTELSALLFPWTAPYYPDHTHLHAQFYGAGRGIVFLAGDDQAPFLLTSIPVIRDLGCNLPIEVFYLGDRDLSESVRAELEALPGVTARDISQMVNDKGWKLAGWAGKPFAILFASFREVIFIDADSLFFQNPQSLFADEAYHETGALFFKDRIIMPQSKRKWLQDVLPKPISEKVLESRFWTGASGHMQESGVVVVDKWRHFVALLLVTRMNGPDRDGNAGKNIVGVYDMVYGDKETFWLGWELAGDTDYAFHDGDAGIMGILEKAGSEYLASSDTNSEDAEGANIDEREPDNYTICAPQLLHLDRDGRPLWFNGWLLPNKYNKKAREPTKFEAFLREPREAREPDAWQLHEHNICCLTSEYKSEFTRDEMEVMDRIIASGRKVGALAKEKS
ncbi:mannosyltransferase putative-domain-containing protein [Aspergillus karnatakaensis]|uniref:putative alpha-1,3-mannosyltransferase n=1 Tax=Aspergillus karnatakaensis TaxID=1810916 RepID=UPI003CCD5B70